MEELDVRVRTIGGLPRQRTGADRHRRRIRPVAAGRACRPRPDGVLRPAPREAAVCAPGVSRGPAPSSPATPAPGRVPRTRACLAPPRVARPGPARPGVGTRAERFLVGAAVVLCSAVVVVALGLLAETAAGRAHAPAGATSAPAVQSGVPVPARQAPRGTGSSGSDAQS